MLAHATEVGLMARADFEQFVSSLAAGFGGTGWQSAYYDDMDWAIEALVSSSALVSNATLRSVLVAAAQELDQVVSGARDQSCCGARPGGYWWDVARTQKACASNMGTARAFCSLARLTHNATLLAQAADAFAFWNASFVKPSGQALDHVDRNGTMHWDVWTYNQGMLIGAAACLNTAEHASVARSALGFMLAQETTGGVLHEGRPCKDSDFDCLEFAGIALRFVGRFADPRVAPLVAVNAQSVVNFTNSEWGLPDQWVGPALPAGTAYSLSAQTSGLAALIVQLELTHCSR